MITVCEYVFSRECKGGVCVDIHARVEAREHLISSVPYTLAFETGPLTGSVFVK